MNCRFFGRLLNWCKSNVQMPKGATQKAQHVIFVENKSFVIGVLCAARPIREAIPNVPKSESQIEGQVSVNVLKHLFA